MKRWQVLKSFAVVASTSNAKRLYCDFIKVDGKDLRVTWYEDGNVAFSDMETGEMHYILYKDGVDHMSGWAMHLWLDI